MNFDDPAFCECILRIAYRTGAAQGILSHDLEDFAQEVAQKVIKSIGNFDSSKGSLKGWICAIIRNMAADWWRKKCRQVKVISIDEVAEVPEKRDDDTEFRLPALPLDGQVSDEWLKDFRNFLGNHGTRLFESAREWVKVWQEFASKGFGSEAEFFLKKVLALTEIAARCQVLRSLPLDKIFVVLAPKGGGVAKLAAARGVDPQKLYVIRDSFRDQVQQRQRELLDQLGV
jgi:RNA polymerase sigma factor (sigma-70 family)